MEEHRQYPRLRLTEAQAQTLQFRALTDGTEAVAPVSDAAAFDISLGGLGFVSTQKLPSGAPIQLQLPGGDVAGLLTVKGQIAWVSRLDGSGNGQVRPQYRYGVRLAPGSEAAAVLQAERAEAAMLAEIGRLISSTPDIAEVYEDVADRVRSLIPFDRMSIARVDQARRTMTTMYVTGVSVAGWEVGASCPLPNMVLDSTLTTGQARRVQTESAATTLSQFPGMRTALAHGLRSAISVPLTARGTTLGVLVLCATERNAYAEREVKLAARVAAQIAGAIANAWAYDELEQRVAERTAELSATNRRLQAELTERQRAEEALRESEEKYRSLFELASDAFLTVLLPDGQITDANRAAVTMLGYSQAELKRLHGAQVIAPEVFAQIQRDWPAQVARQGWFAVETLWVRKDGSRLPVEVSGRPLEVAGRAQYQLIGRDITERKRIEKALREREAMFRQMAETIQEVFYVSDLRIPEMVYISPGYEKVWGRTCASLYDDPRSFLDSIHTDDREHVAASLERQLAGEATKQEYRIRRPDGSIRWILDRAFPIKDEAGRVYRVTGIAADITERRRIEEALRQSETRFRGIFEAAAIGMALVTPEGELVETNAALQHMLGYTAAELRRMTVASITDPADVAYSQRALQSIRSGRQAVVRGVKRYRRKDGRVIWGRVTASVIPSTGDLPQYQVAMVEDITAQREAEERERQAEAAAEAAREAERLKGQVLTLVSHDLVTPLTAIKGTISSLYQFGNLPPDVQQDLATVDQQVDRLHHLVSNLLDLSRLEAGTALARRPHVLSDLVAAVLKQTRPMLTAHPLTVAVPAELPVVDVDATLVQAVLRNLLMNAVHHTPPGTPITVTARPTGEAVAPSSVIVQVADQGPGIPLAERAQVFTPFYRLGQQSQGSGLGLALVRDVIERHGGWIRAEETPGGGATMVFALPVATEMTPRL